MCVCVCVWACVPVSQPLTKYKCFVWLRPGSEELLKDPGLVMALIESVRGDHADAVEKFLQHDTLGPKLVNMLDTQSGETPLSAALRCHADGALKSLLAAKADPKLMPVRILSCILYVLFVLLCNCTPIATGPVSVVTHTICSTCSTIAGTIVFTMNAQPQHSLRGLKIGSRSWQPSRRGLLAPWNSSWACTTSIPTTNHLERTATP